MPSCHNWPYKKKIFIYKGSKGLLSRQGSEFLKKLFIQKTEIYCMYSEH